MQPDGPIIIKASSSKKITYGALTLLGVIAIILSVVLIVTGSAEDMFRRIAWLLFGLLATWRVGLLFMHTSTHLIFKNNTLQRVVFGAKSSIEFNFSTLQHIKAVKSDTTTWGKRPDALLFTDTNGDTFNIDAYLLAALSKKGRAHLLSILEPFILKEGVVRQEDKPDVQLVLSGFNPSQPIKLTEQAEEFALKAKKRIKLAKIILFVGFLPLTILVLLAIAGIVYTTVTCDKLLAEGKETAARITALDAKRDSKSNELTTLRLDLTYNVDGKTYNKEFYVYSLHAKSVYDTIKNASLVQVRYLPDNPKTIELASDFSDGTANTCKF